MFTFDTTPVKFIGLLLLFAGCTAWCLYELTRPQDVKQRISNALHLVMAVVMILMVPKPVWHSFLKVVPMSVLLAVFAVATAWFVGLAVSAFRGGDRRGVGHFAGHAAMFGAMTWHLSAMAVKMPHMGPDMQTWMMAESKPGGTLWILALVGIPFMTYLLAASFLDLRRALRPRASVNDACPCGIGCTCGPACACSTNHTPVSESSVAHDVAPASNAQGVSTRVIAAPVTMAHSCHEERPVGSPPYRLAALSDFAMNFGMFWMSTGLVTAVLPLFTYLAF